MDQYIEKKKRKSYRRLSIAIIIAVCIIAMIFLLWHKESENRKLLEAYDICITAELGFSETDIEKVTSIEGIKDAEMICESREGDIVYRSVSDGRLKPVLLEGRLPEKEGEIVIDESIALDDVSLGKKYNGMKVVGIAKKPSNDDESLKYIYLQLADFNQSGYNRMYIYLKDSIDEASEKEIVKKLDKLGKEAASERYDYLTIEAQKKVDDEKKLKSSVLKKYKESLDEAKEKIDSAKEEFDEESTKKKLDAAEKKLKAAKEKLNASRVALDNTSKKLKNAKAALKEGKKELDEMDAKYLEALKEAGIEKMSMDEALEMLNQLLVYYQDDPEKVQTIQGYINQIDAYKKAQSQYEKEKKKYESAYDKYLKGEKAYTKSKKELNKKEKELSEKKKEFNKVKEEIDDAQKKYDDETKEYSLKEKEFNEKIKEYEGIRDSIKKTGWEIKTFE